MESYFVSLYKHSRKTKVGVKFTRDNYGFINIGYIRPGSIFEETELDVGDVVYEINGLSVEGMSANDVASKLRNAKKVVTLRGDKRKHEVKELSASIRSTQSQRSVRRPWDSPPVPPKKQPSTSRRRKILPNNRYTEEHVFIYQNESGDGCQSFECFHQENMPQAVDSFVR